MAVKHEIITDTKTQRTFLITKVISAQRLALDRCNFSYKFALEKAWVRFVRNTSSGMRSEFGDKCKSSLNKINQLKERMAHL